MDNWKDIERRADTIVDVFGEEMLYRVVGEAAKQYQDMVDYLAKNPNPLSAEELDQIHKEVERINRG